MSTSGKDVQRIIDKGFNNRSRWSEVPSKIQQEVEELMSERAFAKAMEFNDDEDKYFFILGFLHSFLYQAEH